MKHLKILTIPDPRLKQQCASIEHISKDIIELANQMDVLIQHLPHCVGIAAPQVDHPVRLVVVDVSHNRRPVPNRGKTILINPIITQCKGSLTGREGCLSVPEFTGNVTRAEMITIKALSLNGRPVTFQTEGFEAVVFQHEIDHLDGTLFLDRVSSLKTDIFRRKR